MHVLLIHQAFASSRDPGGTRHYELSQKLVKEGHRVTIVASPISYVTGRRVAKDERSIAQDSPPAGLCVKYAWVSPRIHGGFVIRLASFVSFMFFSTASALRVRDVDLVWGTSPPIFQAVSAYIVARLKGVPFVLEIRDLWPQFAIGMGVLRNPLLIWCSRRLERFLYAAAKRLIVNSPGYISHLQSCGILQSNIDLIQNGVEMTMFHPEDSGGAIRSSLGLDHNFVVVYAGAHGLANDLDTVLLAAERLRSHSMITFIFVGDGSERSRLIARATDLKLSNVHFVPARPKSEISSFLAAADVCIAILKAIPEFTTTFPNKVFDYMAAGRPVVLAIDGVIREVVESAQAGLFAEPGNPESLANAILTYYEDRPLRLEHGRNATAYAAAHFDRGKLGEGLKSVFERVHREWSKNLGRSKRLKRFLDVGLAAVAILVLSPVFVAIAIAIRLSMGRPIIFRQPRPGLNSKSFTIFKFRTMVEAHDVEGRWVPDQARLTKLGEFLRKSSLDELPELINVLRGDMSLVGPRPLLMAYLERYTVQQRARHNVLPGITGWAQVNGRNGLSWEEKFTLDLWYVENQSFWLDIKILFLSLWKVLRCEGISQPGHVTAEEFKGQVEVVQENK